MPSYSPASRRQTADAAADSDLDPRCRDRQRGVQIGPADPTSDLVGVVAGHDASLAGFPSLSPPWLSMRGSASLRGSSIPVRIPPVTVRYAAVGQDDLIVGQVGDDTGGQVEEAFVQ